MKSSAWDRIGAATGIGAALTFVGVIVFDPGLHPAFDAPAKAFTSYLQDKGPALRAQAVVAGIFAFLLLWFLGSLRAALRRAEGGDGTLSSICFGAGVAFAALHVAGWGPQATIFFVHVDRMDPERLRDLAITTRVIGDSAVVMGTFVRAALVAAASWCAIRFGGLPRWLGWLGGVVALASLAGALALLQAPQKTILDALGFLGYLGFYVWLLLCGIVLTVGRSADRGRP